MREIYALTNDFASGYDFYDFQSEQEEIAKVAQENELNINNLDIDLDFIDYLNNLYTQVA